MKLKTQITKDIQHKQEEIQSFNSLLDKYTKQLDQSTIDQLKTRDYLQAKIKSTIAIVKMLKEELSELELVFDEQ